MKQFRQAVAISTLALVCMGCGDSVIEEGKDSIKRQLRAPESAQFRDVYLSTKADGVQVACGEVNGDNAYGGKAGFQKFIADGRVMSILEERSDKSDFEEAWKRFCH